MVDELAEGWAKGGTGIKNGDNLGGGRATDRAGQRGWKRMVRGTQGQAIAEGKAEQGG